MIPEHWQAVARGDGETVGFVEAADEEFVGRDLLGFELGRTSSHDEAEAHVRAHGLASLGRSWEWTDGSGQTRRVYIVHVRPGVATVSTGHPNVIGAPGERFEVELPVDPVTFRPV